jgi:hypothetical protein
MENQVQAPLETAPLQPELTISDLNNLKAIVETAIARGTFRAEEITAVGTVYDKVNAFLTAIAASKSAE